MMSKPIRLNVNGVKLHARFSRLVFDALDRMEAQPLLPLLPKSRAYFRASDNSLHSVPCKHLAAARRIDPNLVIGGLTVTTIRRRPPKFTRAEREVLRTLYFVTFPK